MERLLTMLVDVRWDHCTVKIFHGQSGVLTNEFHGIDAESTLSKIGDVLDSERRAEDGEGE